MQRKEGAYLQVFVLPSHFWLLVFTLLFQALSFWHLLLLKQKKRKKNTKKKKKKCKEKRELTFSRFCIWVKVFFLLSLLHIPSTFNVELSTFLKPCVSCLLEALCYSSSGALLSSGDGVTRK